MEVEKLLSKANNQSKHPLEVSPRCHVANLLDTCRLASVVCLNLKGQLATSYISLVDCQAL